MFRRGVDCYFWTQGINFSEYVSSVVGIMVMHNAIYAYDLFLFSVFTGSPTIAYLLALRSTTP
jgi:hypothetical protein